MIVDVCLDVATGLVAQRSLEVSNGCIVLFVFVVGQSSSVVDQWVFLVDSQGVGQVTDSLLVGVELEVNSAPLD